MKPRSKARRKASPEEPTIEEIRSIRRRLLKEAGGSIEGYIQLLSEKAVAARAKMGSRRTAGPRAAKPSKRPRRAG
jgi:hypothetical protein